MKQCLLLLTLFALVCSACEYGDVHGKAESFDRIIGLKAEATETLALRQGGIDFTGFFVFQFPQNTSSFFSSPPPVFFTHPLPLSYERNKVFLKWQRTPVPKEMDYLVTQALSNALAIGLAQERYRSLMALAQNPHAYFAASFEDDHLGKHNLDLYLIDPERRVLYQYVDSNSIYTPDEMGKGETTK